MSTVLFDPRKKKDPEEETKPTKPSELIGVALGVLAIPLFFMLLWNWLMTSIFALPAIGYFKATGLLALSFMLFRK